LAFWVKWLEGTASGEAKMARTGSSNV